QMPDIETPVILKEEKNNRVEAVLVNNKTTNELELYCHSQEKGIHSSWQTLREILSTQSRITSSMKLENGQIVKIRKTSSPNAEQMAIYQALGLTTSPAKTEKTEKTFI
ncbi:MAG: hypothetical protein NTW94_02800, partial [Legionellales bacterium]|nr:hypothetical protein [Legionellales bacterium]